MKDNQYKEFAPITTTCRCESSNWVDDDAEYLEEIGIYLNKKICCKCDATPEVFIRGKITHETIEKMWPEINGNFSIIMGDEAINIVDRDSLQEK